MAISEHLTQKSNKTLGFKGLIIQELLSAFTWLNKEFYQVLPFCILMRPWKLGRCTVASAKLNSLPFSTGLTPIKEQKIMMQEFTV